MQQRPEGLGEAHPVLILLRLVPLLLPTHPQGWSGLEVVDVAEEGLEVDEVAEGVEGHKSGRVRERERTRAGALPTTEPGLTARRVVMMRRMMISGGAQGQDRLLCLLPLSQARAGTVAMPQTRTTTWRRTLWP